MGPKRLDDLLHELADLHRRLSERYSERSVAAAREDAKFFFAHLCRMEQYMEHCIHEYAHTAPKSLREAWVKCAPDFDLTRLVQHVPNDKDVSRDEIMDAAVTIGDELEKSLRELVERTTHEELRSTLLCLVEMEREEKGKILRSGDFY